jgi:uncharacterized repeat protein (TIGR03803 family)
MNKVNTLACKVLSTFTVMAALLSSNWVAKAETVSVLVQFPGSEGLEPKGALLQASNGLLYGTTTSGNDGTIFKFDRATGIYTTIHTFNYLTTGRYPIARLIQGNDGNLYGSTSGGGSSNKGTLFKLNPQTGVFTTLHSFTSGASGEGPKAELLQASDGSFYGTTGMGGANSVGSIFKMTAGGTVTTLRSFAIANGRGIGAGLVEGSDGFFYGTATMGGAAGLGTIYKINSAGTLTNILSFNGTNGSGPNGTLVMGSDGFYGTTSGGGAFSKGTIYKLSFAGVLTTLHSFGGSDGATPYCGLILGSDGSFYGTTMFGGTSGLGTVFKMSPGGSFTVLRSFNSTDGKNPSAALLLADNALFYGVTSSGGAGTSRGTLFSISSTGTFSSLKSFKGSPARPYSGLTQGSDGSLYGSTDSGGAFFKGSVYKVNLAGKIDLLHGLNGSVDGEKPRAKVIQGSDGNFYSTAWQGGAASGGGGTVFKVTSGGVFTLLRSCLIGQNPSQLHSGLIQGVDGNFYGTSLGANDGTIYKITPAGVTTVLHSFNGANGTSVQSDLTRGSDGNLYGTATGGGANNTGTIFKITPAGAFTLLHSFTGAAGGSNPRGALIEGTGGDYFGVTSGGGTLGFGSIFKFNVISRTYTSLYSFRAIDGAYPVGLLMTQGNLYGATQINGANAFGTIYKYNLSTGIFTKLHDFNGANGQYSQAPLVLASDGNLYGTTLQGGAANNGVIFRVAMGGGTADSTPPSVPTGLTGSAISSSQINLSWTASTDAVGVTGYKIYRGGIQVGTASGTTYSNTGLTASTTYSYTVAAYDAAGNVSDQSVAKTVTTLAAADTTSPTVSITAPAGGATVSGTVTISANASDPTVAGQVTSGVAGVQFKVGGVNVGVEDTSSSYSTSWDTTTIVNGSYTLTAVARDIAGNVMTSSVVTVNVSNPVADTTNPTVSITAPAGGATVSGTVTISANASDPTVAGQVTSGVAGVQFKVGGVNVGVEDTSSSYSTSWDTTTIVNGSYTLTAVARDVAGNSTLSSAISITVNNVVVAPSTLSAALSGAQIQLAWSDLSNNETSFKIERKLGSGGTYALIGTVGANVTSYIDTSVVSAEAAQYVYRVKAVASLGESAYSNEASIPPVTIFGAISGGSSHTIAVKHDGTIWVWGANGSGQYGNGTTNASTTAIQTTGFGSGLEVAGGTGFSLTLRADGTVWGSGENAYGQLGNGGTLRRSTPINVSSLSSVVTVASGYQHAVALKSDGTVWTWGRGDSGQIGNGSSALRTLVPVQLTALGTNVTAIAAGRSHTIAMKSDGTVWSWGNNAYGQLGNGTTSSVNVPTQIPTLSNVIDVSAGDYHTLVLKSDGTVWAFGHNGNGRLGDGSSVSTRLSPVKVSTITGGGLRVSAGASHSMALKDDGTVWAWGLNTSGQLGNGTLVNKSVPTLVNGLSGILAIDAGGYHSIALKDDGTVWTFGENSSGQLGNGVKVDASTPVQATGLDLIAP